MDRWNVRESDKKKSATFIQIKAANNHYWMRELLFGFFFLTDWSINSFTV